MAQAVRDVMTRDPVTIEGSETVTELARRMRTADSGAIVVLRDGSVAGIATDRDIAVRAVAEGKDPNATRVADICSHPNATRVADICSPDVETIGPDAGVEQVVQTMRSRHVRRVPVVENGHAVGIVSIGDLAMERDQRSALADISAAAGNT